jgi:hypothetical protein
MGKLLNGAEMEYAFAAGFQVLEQDGAGDGNRTRDVQLGKMAVE